MIAGDRSRIDIVNTDGAEVIESSERRRRGDTAEAALGRICHASSWRVNPNTQIMGSNCEGSEQPSTVAYSPVSL